MCLRRRPGEIRIEGVGSSAAVYSKGHITVQMQAAFDNNINFKLEAYVVPTITSVTPDTHIDAEAWSHLKDLPLADPTFATPSPVDLLLGADVLTGLFQEGFIQGSPEQLCALNTRLGWVVFGPVTSSAHSTLHTSLTAKCVNEQRLDTLLRSFWELEEPIPSSEIHVDDCETIFNDTVTRTSDGRYQVQILFRPDAPALGESHQSAVRQFLQLERRLMNDPCLREQYITFMREYIALDHMEVSKQAFTNKENGYFIPHHAVTTKFRVVFNASAKTSNGTSLNDTQFSGPQLHANIVDILHRFRKCKVAITADIQKMFRQILVDRRHRKWQQILWRELPNEPLQVYELKTVTYGMACSPFNAIRALRQCANDNYEVIYDPSRAAAARHSILYNFYVDDYLDSVDSDELAITRAQDVATILKQGQLILGKWNSNSTHVLSAITGTTLSASELELNNSTTKVLGLYWDPVSDELFFKVGLVDDTSMHTKRKVLSDVAKLYDPTGVLAPVVVVAKLFIQDLWKAGLPWDAELPPELLSSWVLFRNSLQDITRLRIPRWLGIRVGSLVHLHGFCDASRKAYAAVIYVQTIDKGGTSRTALVSAKTKIAPIKDVTIPRLELCGAHLLTKAMDNVRQALGLQDAPCTYWSDSTIVLCWIRKPPSTFKQYVSNRVAYIQANSDINAWKHIRSESNPADCASRGLSPAVLADHHLWWTGPTCIHQSVGEMRLPSLTEEEEHLSIAESRVVSIFVSRANYQWIMTSTKDNRIPLIEKFSKLSRLLNTTVWLRRWLPKYRGYRNDIVSVADQHWALLLHIRQAQGNHFKQEIKALELHSRIAGRSEILALNPFLDADGILRVGGRLANSDLSEDQRHQTIIPRGALAYLLVADAHTRCLHGGIQQMLQFLRQRFWLIGARAQVKSFIWACTTCRRHLQIIQRQQMASLPKERVLVAPPFSRSGLDYCGPFHVRVGTHRATPTTKTYAAIFICMASRAVHIELAEDLSTQGLIVKCRKT
ncbi:uncharacterized protein LOC126754498 isoform X2 [Bactrocera neohumeralis]|uniref:uncharacterized protein LOC126754498 isoform X2 n=1 Tax=Bactrocera neohumeralis TaxID=98809 RepID=UPI00216544A1|nr:uncharacterized protein LOC126754498 isoform X2 [Bactrocera neohumeralis]